MHLKRLKPVGEDKMKTFAEIRNHVTEGVKDLKNFKNKNRKAEASMTIEIVKGNTSNKFDDDFGFNQAEMSAMDKVISKVKSMHISSFDGGEGAPASLEFYGDKTSLDTFLKDSSVVKTMKKYKAKVNGPYINK